eukprot:CAMPEP_0185341170 /NCGR_PEP_ID=MMETSP1363-20130426/98491_1 /TAXON_ID=38817 /ORGANISM="Gephyrocapsa oceanica, Strain RCC1303" /LENGTH=398 /DNA_ID=CAMNT_0027940397 /DNA_START=198 /DNA_END=1391 /DNA_ORIENTATION=-
MADSSNDGDVGARAPHLGGELTVPPPAKDVLAREEGGGDGQRVLDGERVEVGSTERVGEEARVCARHRGKAGKGLCAVGRASRVGGVPGRAAAGATSAAVLAGRHLVVARVRVAVRERHPHPPLRRAAVDLRRGQLDHPVGEERAVRGGRKGERRALEALLRQRLASLAEPEAVPAAVLRRHLPPRSCCAAAPPDGPRRTRLEHLRAQVALHGMDGGVEGARVVDLLVRPARLAARVKDGRLAGSPPGVVAPDVVVRAGLRVKVCRPPLLVEVGAVGERLGFCRARAVIPRREALALPVAGGTTNRAALREPEAGLPRVAFGIGAVGAPAVVRLDPASHRVLSMTPRREAAVNGVAWGRADHRGMAATVLTAEASKTARKGARVATAGGMSKASYIGG